MSTSVIIPTHDRRSLLPRALDSLRAQTRPPDQIIVIDDGSHDGTAEMVRRAYPEVTLIEQPQAGVSAARNRGIERSCGEWIALLDSDDAWLPDKLEVQLDALAATPSARICHTDEIWVRNGVRVNPRKKHAKHGGWIFGRCLPLCCMSPSSIVLHRSVFERVGMFDESLPACEDYDLWLRITCRYPVLLVDRPLVIKYGGHADQLSRTVWGLDRFRIRALDKILADEALSARQRAAVRTVLRDKIRIFGDGAAKRGKIREAQRYRAMLQRLGPERGNHELAGR
jgi:glycosyltransferase involved in cell wall biosynthesis